MNLGALPVPVQDPLPLPGPEGLIWALLQLTLTLHLVAMNVALGGSFLALLWRRSEEPHARTFVAWFAKALPVAVAATVTLGVAPLLFVQVLYGRLFFTSAILLGGYWLALVPLLIAAYYGAYRLAYRSSVPLKAGVGLAVAVTLLFLAVSFLHSSNAALQLRPEVFLAKYHLNPTGFHLGTDDPSLLPRWLHAVLGAVAVAGIFVALVGWLRRKSDPPFAAWAARAGLAWFAWTTGLNVILGTWYALALPRTTLARIAGADPWAVSLLVVGSLLSMALLVIAILALSSRDPVRAVPLLASHLVATLFAMVLLREEVRQSSLLRMGYAPHGWVEPQWSAIAAFVVCLLVAVAAIAWMIRALARGEAQTSSPSRYPASPSTVRRRPT